MDINKLLILIGLKNQEATSSAPAYRMRQLINKIQIPKHVEAELYDLLYNELYDSLYNNKPVNSENILQSHLWRTEIEPRLIR